MILKPLLVFVLLTFEMCNPQVFNDPSAPYFIEDGFMDRAAMEVMGRAALTELHRNITSHKCRDHSEDCEQWVKQGLCKGNQTVSAMVIELCQKSCKLCGSRVKCTDVNALCPTWRKVGFCNGSDVISKEYMDEKCKFSCGLCQEACEDETVNCEDLTKLGHCSANRPWMKQHCKKSCKFCTDNRECGISNMKCRSPRQARILSMGEDNEVEQNQVPWQVYIEMVETEEGEVDEFCGGIIISQRWVLTAAHCVADEWDVLRLSFGSANRYKPEKYHRLHQSIDASNVIKYPEYDASHYDHDIALINLNRNLIFSENIQPICLGPYEEDIIGKLAIVTGWGHKKHGGKASEHLLKACVEVKPCSQWADNIQLELTDNMICAHTNGNDACQGDSGGPMVMETEKGSFILIGIISQGKGCGLPGLPGVYTKLSNYISWIAEVTSKGQH